MNLKFAPKKKKKKKKKRTGSSHLYEKLFNPCKKYRRVLNKSIYDYCTVTHDLKMVLNLVDTSGMHFLVQVPKYIAITADRRAALRKFIFFGSKDRGVHVTWEEILEKNNSETIDEVRN